MAEKLSKWPKDRKQNRFDFLADGSVWKVTPEEFGLKNSRSLYGVLSQYAKRHGLSITTQALDDSAALAVQFTPKDAHAHRPPV